VVTLALRPEGWVAMSGQWAQFLAIEVPLCTAIAFGIRAYIREVNKSGRGQS
jgi:hypothetical protein